MSNGVLYTEADLTAATRERRKRQLLTLIPACLLLAMAIAVFVWFRLHHDVSGWIWSALLTLAGGAYALFFGGAYLRPVSLYARHIGHMLDGPHRETTGVVSHVEPTPQDKDGLDFYPFTINIGTVADPKDDRLFYYDALKGSPPFAEGDRVRVRSNDSKAACVEPAREES